MLEARLRAPCLSRRERQVLELLAQGFRLREAAAKLGISYWTVDTYCRQLHQKFNVQSRVNLLSRAREAGFLS